MTGILEGIKVVEMGVLVAIPAATATMADWGADILKIEPLEGEMTRGVNALEDQDDPAAALPSNNWRFQVLNRGKRSMAVDLKTEAGRGIVYRILRETDIFLTNYTPSAVSGLGMDYRTLIRINPKLVYGSLNGFGTKGPDRDLRGLDYTAAWARGGLMHTLAEPGGRPVAPRNGMMDRVAGAHLLSGVCAALMHRDKSGKGQKIDISLYQTAVWTLAEDVQAEIVGQGIPNHDRFTPQFTPTFNNYRTKDGKWFWLSGMGFDWPKLCEILGRPDLAEQYPTVDKGEAERHYPAVVEQLDQLFAGKTRKQWERIFRKHNIVHGFVTSQAEIIEDKQALANSFFPSLEHPDEEMRVVATPVQFRENPISIKAPAPELGQHTEETLLDLGYDWEEIAELKEQGIIL